MQFLVDFLPFGSRSVDPHIFADPDPGSQNLADPTDPDPKHWFCSYVWGRIVLEFLIYQIKNLMILFSKVYWLDNLLELDNNYSGNMIHILSDITSGLSSLKVISQL